MIRSKTFSSSVFNLSALDTSDDSILWFKPLRLDEPEAPPVSNNADNAAEDALLLYPKCLLLLDVDSFGLDWPCFGKVSSFLKLLMKVSMSKSRELCSLISSGWSIKISRDRFKMDSLTAKEFGDK
ncbi:hypothetical protein WICPIJ_004829 [Wickerhamomyces pijperi]|uniref:Uncharacterized protein n=1 Tax=Wickerhamomyces pijperi TaxID=599730 RepID=A0A9P8TMW9_WICPI|nr:hypothetical protein WICPIJ_004829 [Wickerhamomyces pijperi]